MKKAMCRPGVLRGTGAVLFVPCKLACHGADTIRCAAGVPGGRWGSVVYGWRAPRPPRVVQKNCALPPSAPAPAPNRIDCAPPTHAQPLHRDSAARASLKTRGLSVCHLPIERLNRPSCK
eukprot:scaffold99124_cov62-Phaeocystis_antarctica.AAC.1